MPASAVDLNENECTNIGGIWTPSGNPSLGSNNLCSVQISSIMGMDITIPAFTTLRIEKTGSFDINMGSTLTILDFGYIENGGNFQIHGTMVNHGFIDNCPGYLCDGSPLYQIINYGLIKNQDD